MPSYTHLALSYLLSNIIPKNRYDKKKVTLYNKFTTLNIRKRVSAENGIQQLT